MQLFFYDDKLSSLVYTRLATVMRVPSKWMCRRMLAVASFILGSIVVPGHVRGLQDAQNEHNPTFRAKGNEVGNISSPLPGEIDAKREFLTRASREVEHYTQAFADLTADETRRMQAFDQNGFLVQQRLIQSVFVVYQLRNDPKSVIEAREVISVDGHEVKGHAARSTRLWGAVAVAHSSQEEAKRIRDDSERYDVGMKQTGFTLFEALPLRPQCVGDFDFRELPAQNVNGREVRMFTYRQTRPCKAVEYYFGLPSPWSDAPLIAEGELELDSQTAQVIREECNVYAGTEKRPVRVAHVASNYRDSAFSILVPREVIVETFLPVEDNRMSNVGFRLHARMVQTYGPFSRFEVHTGEKLTLPQR